MLGIVAGTLDGDAYTLVGTGLLGAYTTFSTWMLESHRLGEDGRLPLGVVNFALLARGRHRGGLAGAAAVNEDCLKLTAYFGERDRARDRWLADALIDIYARHELETSLVMRGVEGFGAKQHLHTDRLLTLSEDLPLVAVARRHARADRGRAARRRRRSRSTGW